MTTKIFCIAFATLGFLCDKKDEATAVDAAPEAAAPVQSATADVDAAPSATATATHHVVVLPKPSATTTATAAANTCPAANQAAFAGAGGAKVCHVTCNTNTDCSKNAPGTKCTGSGQLIAADGSRTATMKFCQ